MSESTAKHKNEAPKKINFGVFICSTSRYQKLIKDKTVTDISGNLIESLLKDAGHDMLFKKIIPDSSKHIREEMQCALEAASRKTSSRSLLLFF